MPLKIKKILPVLFLVLLYQPSVLVAQSYRDRPEVTFGPKLGYTFGRNGGFTWGLEVTYFPPINSFHRTIRYGITFDLTSWGGNNASFHIGAELLSNDCIGIDVGPSLLIDKGRITMGISGIAFLGLVLYPYYEVLVSDHTTYQSFGGYVKFIASGKLPTIL